MPSARVLIVEDEPLIAMMLEDFLDMLGYALAGSVDNVNEAVALVEGGNVDLAILDVNLRGGEKSWPIADALAARDIPFVIATGGTADVVADKHRDRPQLQKPYTMDGVAAALEAL